MLLYKETNKKDEQKFIYQIFKSEEMKKLLLILSLEFSLIAVQLAIFKSCKDSWFADFQKFNLVSLNNILNTDNIKSLSNVNLLIGDSSIDGSSLDCATISRNVFDKFKFYFGVIIPTFGMFIFFFCIPKIFTIAKLNNYLSIKRNIIWNILQIIIFSSIYYSTFYDRLYNQNKPGKAEGIINNIIIYLLKNKYVLSKEFVATLMNADFFFFQIYADFIFVYQMILFWMKVKNILKHLNFNSELILSSNKSISAQTIYYASLTFILHVLLFKFDVNFKNNFNIQYIIFIMLPFILQTILWYMEHKSIEKIDESFDLNLIESIENQPVKEEKPIELKTFAQFDMFLYSFFTWYLIYFVLTSIIEDTKFKFNIGLKKQIRDQADSLHLVQIPKIETKTTVFSLIDGDGKKLNWGILLLDYINENKNSLIFKDNNYSTFIMQFNKLNNQITLIDANKIFLDKIDNQSIMKSFIDSFLYKYIGCRFGSKLNLNVSMIKSDIDVKDLGKIIYYKLDMSSFSGWLNQSQNLIAESIFIILDVLIVFTQDYINLTKLILFISNAWNNKIKLTDEEKLNQKTKYILLESSILFGIGLLLNNIAFYNLKVYPNFNYILILFVQSYIRLDKYKRLDPWKEMLNIYIPNNCYKQVKNIIESFSSKLGRSISGQSSKSIAKITVMLLESQATSSDKRLLLQPEHNSSAILYFLPGHLFILSLYLLNNLHFYKMIIEKQKKNNIK